MQDSVQSIPYLPKDGQIIASIMKAMGIMECEPQVIPMLLELMYRNCIDILRDASIFAAHAKKTEIDINCLRYAIKTRSSYSYISPPPRDLMLEISAKKNSLPLPLISLDKYIHLPPDEYCMYGHQSQLAPIPRYRK